MKELIEAYGGRRFLLTLICCLGTMILAACGKIDGAAYATVQIGIVGLYIGGNTYQKKTEIGVKNAD